MLTNEDIEQIIKECRSIADTGLGNGNRADIPELLVDVVQPPNDFLGVDGNPAIFINQHTFKLLGHLHSNWIVNQTIALKRELLNRRTIEILGVIIHETGHAFNVAARISNTEANSYIFEIEVMLHLYNTKNPVMKNCSITELLAYFDLRLKYYNKSSKGNDYLLSLIEQVHQFQTEHKAFLPMQKERSFSKPFLQRGCSFFQSHEHDLVHECGSFFIDEYELQPRNPACLQPG
ncbi:hypothetical protein [Legionella shakespearei]|uniref:Uncharacterized protein n=1 Tax=Legionella shakespearei DSM 23087 TaxID=1122169 RepID=A0A0W0Z2Z0_9GAMM|nr:hypothetical protein [Legionella shakespearei]KTD63110.1 hypothetical protein Lsha_0796 [Legionella shakespearei DSM 23087]